MRTKTTAQAAVVPVSTNGAITALHEATRETIPAVPLDHEVAEAWRRFPALHGTVRIPELGSPWTPAEYANAADALKTARALRHAADLLEKTVTEGHLTDLDLQARTRAALDPAYDAKLKKLPLSSKGHYILGEAGRQIRTPIPGSTDLEFSAEYKVGKEQMSVESLNALVDSHTISRREFRRLTRTILIIDTEAVERETSRNISLRERLRGAVKRSTSSISVHLREPKTASL